jgi:thiol-disulfide isomerase/thioredoxin
MSEAPVRAPEFPDHLVWLNSEKRLQLRQDLQGRVVLLDFWTYCCINCVHMLPDLGRLEREFADEPLSVIGVHSPKFENERKPRNVHKALDRLGISHPVAVDADREVWSAYAVGAWPTMILVDGRGYVREEMRGEVPIDELRRKIRRLLDETGLAAPAPSVRIADPETRTLRFPGKVEADAERLYIADSGNHRILVCDHSGKVLTVLGGTEPGHEDGRYDRARFCDPQGMSAGDGVLWVADRGNHLVRQVQMNLWWVKTVAGTGKLGTTRGAVDPKRPLSIGLRSPWDVHLVDRHLIIAMAGSHQIWLYDIEKNEVGAWAGSGVEDHIDGPMQQAAFAQPSGLSQVGPWLMIADTEVSSLRAIDMRKGEAQTLTGGGLFDFGDQDGDAETMAFQHPMDLAVVDQDLYVADTYNHKIKAVNLPTMQARTLVGNGRPGILDEPAGICAVGDRLLVADTNHHRVVWVDPRTGAITPLEISGID